MSSTFARRWKLAAPLLALLALLALLTACKVVHTREGDDNVWREELGFVEGETTSDDVLARLGPPTQVYDFGPRSAYLYQLVEDHLQSFSVIVYERSWRSFHVDRAVLFFDESGVLEAFSLSETALPRESSYVEDPWQWFTAAEEGDQ